MRPIFILQKVDTDWEGKTSASSPSMTPPTTSNTIRINRVDTICSNRTYQCDVTLCIDVYVRIWFPYHLALFALSRSLQPNLLSVFELFVHLFYCSPFFSLAKWRAHTHTRKKWNTKLRWFRFVPQKNGKWSSWPLLCIAFSIISELS